MCVIDVVCFRPGLLSSPDSKPRAALDPPPGKQDPVADLKGSGGAAAIKEEIKEESAIKSEPAMNPGSVGKMPNGDVNSGMLECTCMLSYSPRKKFARGYIGVTLSAVGGVMLVCLHIIIIVCAVNYFHVSHVIGMKLLVQIGSSILQFSPFVTLNFD